MHLRFVKQLAQSVRRERLLFSGGITAGILLGTATVALAYSATGGTGSVGPVQGRDYNDNSTVWTQQSGSPSDWGSSYMGTQSGATVPAGWMGVNARKYKNGALCEQTGFKFNGSAANGQSALAASTPCGSGTYNSHGLVEAFNGNNTYYQVDTPPSPNANG